MGLNDAWGHHQSSMFPEITESATDEKMRRRLEEDALGADILNECRIRLMTKFRFLDLALWRMELEPTRAGARYPLATDGKRVLYDPPRVIARFQHSFDEIVRDYLHMVMHCIFRHPYDKMIRNREVWDLTCDIIVESAVIDLCGTRFKSDDDLERMMEISKIKMAAGGMSPGRVYKFLEQLSHTALGQHFQGISAGKFSDWQALFEQDDHFAWPKNAKPDQTDDGSGRNDPDEFSENDESDMQDDGLRADSPEGQSAEDDRGQRGSTEGESDSSNTGKSRESSSGESDQEQNQNQDQQDSADLDSAEDDQDPEEGGAQKGNSDGNRDREDAQDPTTPPEANPSKRDEENSDEDQDERDWEELSKQIAMNLKTFSKEWGEEAGSLIANLQLANRKTHDYTEFLRKFMATNEEMRINMDEFDNIFYTYGLELYGNMPLVEPLEYKEAQTIHDFVIAIDTSESVSGDLVKSFVQHTFDILKSSEDFSREVNIHVIQADSKVQSDLKITDMDDVDKMVEGFAVRGFGGTDFRPAFDYVEMLRGRGDLPDLKGLIYFTDGYGQFPTKAPDFDAAFVFVDDGERDIPPVPPWAIKVVLDEELLKNEFNNSSA